MLEARTLTPLFSLDSHFKKASDECRWLQAVSFFYDTNLDFPEHVLRFIIAASVRHALSNEKKPIPSLTSRLMRAMAFLDKVVEVIALPLFAGIWQGLFRFQLASTLSDRLRLYQL